MQNETCALVHFPGSVSDERALLFLKRAQDLAAANVELAFQVAADWRARDSSPSATPEIDLRDIPSTEWPLRLFRFVCWATLELGCQRILAYNKDV